MHTNDVLDRNLQYTLVLAFADDTTFTPRVDRIFNARRLCNQQRSGPSTFVVFLTEGLAQHFL